jgi:hypothetical protein
MKTRVIVEFETERHADATNLADELANLLEDGLNYPSDYIEEIGIISISYFDEEGKCL